MLCYVADTSLGEGESEPLTRARWLTEGLILATTTQGNLYLVQLSRDAQGAECLMQPRVVYRAQHDVAIWDIVAMKCADRAGH
jgi:hypothetical protein